jgi:hypothetical protein
MDANIGSSAEYEAKKARLAEITKAYADLIVEYDQLRNVILPNAAAEYMMEIGKKEYELFSLQFDIQRLKREISLCQAAINRGEPIDDEMIQATIQKEMAEYIQQLNAQKEAVKHAEALFAAKKMSAADSEQLKALYREVVKLLHPDVCPLDTPSVHELWLRAVDAYKTGDLGELALVKDMADELLGRKGADRGAAGATSGAMALLDGKIAKLDKKRRTLQVMKEDLESVPPLSYRELLHDPKKVLEKRQELDRQIAVANQQLASLLAFRDQLTEKK